MRKRSWPAFGLWLIVWLLLSGTVHADTGAPYRVFLPMWQPPHAGKLGLAGGTPQQMPQQRYRIYLPNWIAGPEVTKRGVGTPYGDLGNVELLRVGWYYDWGPYPPLTDVARAYAMVWGLSETLPEIHPDVYGVLGINEGDLAVQGNASPYAAAVQWHAMREKYGGQFRLVFHAASPWGREWLQATHDWYVRLYDEEIGADELAAHCYFATADECIKHVEWHIAKAREWGVRGVRVTEFAVLPCAVTTTGVRGAGSPARALAEMEKLIAWFEATPEVLGYAAYASEIRGDEWWAFQPASCDTALVRDGRLTVFGAAYMPLR